MFKVKNVLSLISICALFDSCAKGINVSQCVSSSHIYGFWGGLWHGLISFFDLIGMIFWDDVVVYAPNNNGGWYAFGFCLGAGIIAKGLSLTSKK